MTAEHRRDRAGRAALWLPGLAVAIGAAVATAHGLLEVALAAQVPAGIAWLYPLITDGLALVAYTATARLTGRAARYAWSVVVLAAGLSGLAQAAYLASGATLDASAPLRFGVGAWPALAAAIAAHLLYLLTAEHGDERRPVQSAPVQPARPDVQPPPPVDTVRPLDGPPRPTRRPAPPVTRPALVLTAVDRSSASSGDTPARARARAAALRFAARNGALPTVNALAEAADVSRGTAATVLKPLRDQPLPLHLITTTSDPDTEETDQP